MGKPLDVKPLIDNLSFIKNKLQYHTHFQGGIRKVSKEDYIKITKSKTEFNDSVLLLDSNLAQNISKETNLWLIRAGDTGQGEKTALEKNCIGIGYDGLHGLDLIKDFERFKEHYKKTHPNDNNNRVGRVVPQIWDFMYEVKIGFRNITT